MCIQYMPLYFLDTFLLSGITRCSIFSYTFLVPIFKLAIFLKKHCFLQQAWYLETNTWAPGWGGGCLFLGECHCFKISMDRSRKQMSIRNHEFKLVSPIPFHLHRALLAFHHSISWIPFLQVRMLFPKNISIFTFLFSPEMQKKLFQYCYTHNIMKVNHLKRIKDLFTAFFFR